MPLLGNPQVENDALDGLGESIPLLEDAQPEDNHIIHSQRSETEPIAKFVNLPPCHVKFTAHEVY